MNGRQKRKKMEDCFGLSRKPEDNSMEVEQKVSVVGGCR